MEFSIKLIIMIYMTNIIFCLLYCPNSNKPPQEIEIDESKTIKPIFYSNKTYTSINIANKIFLTEDTHEGFEHSQSSPYPDSDYCPTDFKIPLQEDYKRVIDNLGSKAYTVFTDKNGFNMEKGKYYLTNTRGTKDLTSKMLLYLDGNSLKFLDYYTFINTVVVRCMLNIPETNFLGKFKEKDIDYNEKIIIKTDNQYLNGYLWKIDDDILKTESIEYTFTKIKEYKLEFWGKYINNSEVYLCDIIYVNKKPVSNSQSFDESKIKTIETNFSLLYNNQFHFTHSNNPIAPRDNGGYYIAVTDIDKFLHILSYDKNDNLINDLNTTEKAFPFDITATDYGLATYVQEADSSYHSYINLYNKKLELIKTIQIMNNNEKDNPKIDSNLEKQIIKYDYNGNPVFGMRFMYRPTDAKLIYSRGRIFLIFAHYNDFKSDGGHTGDTVVTFNDYLLDMDFGVTWGASHSLIQSATFDNNFFWTAALSDAFPEGIKVQYTSKKEFTRSFDPVNKRYNSRVENSRSDLAGYIKGYHKGPADGKLGGILYFDKYKLYCLVYAKTPNYSDELQKNGTNIIYVTTWKFENNEITNNKTYEIKVFRKDIISNVMQLRAGKYGDDKIIIIYREIDYDPGFWGYRGDIPKGTVPKVFVIRVSDMKTIIYDKIYDNLLMNTNEDLKTFRDGVLIWGATNKDGKLVIHKIGTPLLDDTYEDINITITKDDIEFYKKKRDEEEGRDENTKENENNFSLDITTITLIVAGLICFIGIAIIIIYCSIKHCKRKNNDLDEGVLSSEAPSGKLVE